MSVSDFRAQCRSYLASPRLTPPSPGGGDFSPRRRGCLCASRWTKKKDPTPRGVFPAWCVCMCLSFGFGPSFLSFSFFFLFFITLRTRVSPCHVFSGAVSLSVSLRFLFFFQTRTVISVVIVPARFNSDAVETRQVSRTGPISRSSCALNWPRANLSRAKRDLYLA